MTDTSAELVPWPDSVRRAVVRASVAGYGVAVAGFALGLAGAELSPLTDLRGVVVLGVVAVPPTLGALSTRDRPLMLLPAGVIGIAGILGFLSVVGLLLVIPGFIWLWAYLRLRPQGLFVRKFSMAAVPLLWIGAIAGIIVHIDPRCEQTLVDGSVVRVDPASRGFEGGWIWDLDTSSFSGSGTASADVVSEACSSDAVVPWEMAASFALSIGAVWLAWALAGEPRQKGVPAALVEPDPV